MTFPLVTSYDIKTKRVLKKVFARMSNEGSLDSPLIFLNADNVAGHLRTMCAWSDGLRLSVRILRTFRSHTLNFPMMVVVG